MKADKPIEILIAAVSKRLGELYPDVKVYVEQIKQNMPEESFVIYCSPANNRKVSYNRYQMIGSLDIAYVVRDDSDEKKLKELFADRFQNVTTGMHNLRYKSNRLRISEFSYQEVDNVLHMIGSFEIQYFVAEETDG